MIAVLLALALPAAAQFEAPPSAPPTLATICENFLFADEPDRRMRLLQEIARTPIVTPNDAAKALEVFAREPDDQTRAAVLSSVELADPNNPGLEQAFASMIASGEPEPLIVGLRGAARLRSAAARPMIVKLAKKKFKARRPGDLPFVSERDGWLAQYEAVYALARIDGDRAFDLVKNKTRQAPALGQVLASMYWEKALPLVAQWAASKDSKDAERANEAMSAPVPTPALRAAREKMLALVRDPKTPRTLRHNLALKTGFSSTEAEAEALTAEHDKTADEETRLMLAAAVFASRTRAAVPLLTKYLKENADPRLRAGARRQLRDTLPDAEYLPLLKWAAESDADPALRAEAAQELAKLPSP